MKNGYIIIIPVFLFFVSFMEAQNTLYYPVDIVYNEAAGEYYVANWADGEGYIVRMDTNGDITGAFATDLTYPGGLCLIGNTLYVDDNLGLWGEGKPSRMKAYNVNTGEKIVDTLLLEAPSYFDLMTTDNQGFIYFGNSERQKMYKYNIQTQELSVFLNSVENAYGVYYDEVSNRLLYTKSSNTISFIRSVNLDGSNDHNVFYVDGYLEGIVKDDNDNFYFSSWGTQDGQWGNEPVYKTTYDFQLEISSPLINNRPFGMCVGYDNYLVVCNWGSHELKYFNINTFSVSDIKYEGDFTVFPNPAPGKFKIKMENIEPGELGIYVFDQSGRTVYYEQSSNRGNVFEKEINPGLTKGIYVVKVISESFVYTQKVVIVK